MRKLFTWLSLAAMVTVTTSVVIGDPEPGQEDDCNANGVPDSVDVDPANCFSQDCDGSGVPDDCEGGMLCSMRINEVRLDEKSDPTLEYFELKAAPGTSLAGLTYIVIGDDAQGSSGVVEAAIDLDDLGPGQVGVVSDNYFAVGDTGLQGNPGIDAIVDLNFEDDDNVTHVVVSGFTGSVGDDLDTNDDGGLDIQPWSGVIHAMVFLKDEATPPTGTEHAYPLTGVGGPPTIVGPVGISSASHGFVCRYDDNWRIQRGLGDWAPADTPGEGNVECAMVWCAEDLDGDGTIEHDDLILVWPYNPGPCCGCAEDVNFDGVHDILDFDQVLLRYGQSCCVGDVDQDGAVTQLDYDTVAAWVYTDCDCPGRRDIDGSGNVGEDDLGVIGDHIDECVTPD